MFCIAGVVTESFALYFSSLTFVVITMVAVERWSKISSYSASSHYSLCSVCSISSCHVSCSHVLEGKQRDQKRIACSLLIGHSTLYRSHCLCLLRVFWIIRHHQIQVQTNENAIDMEKYKKSIFTILYILGVFVLSYIPFLCCLLVLFLEDKGDESSVAAVNACAAVVFSSSFFNPLLYCWRIKEIRDNVINIVRNLFCNESVDGP